MNNFQNDYSYPNAIASKFEEIEGRLDEIESSNTQEDTDSHAGGAGIYVFGSSLAMILSWSRNASILYCLGHGLASWFYVIYFAFTR